MRDETIQFEDEAANRRSEVQSGMLGTQKQRTSGAIAQSLP